MNLRNQIKRRMEKIKPEIPLKWSMNGKKIYVCVCVCIIQRISKSNGKALLTRKKKSWKILPM